MDAYKPRLVHLPGTKLTPEVVLHRTLNKLKYIKAVTVVIEWNDTTFAIDYSQQSVATLCMGSMVLHDDVMRVVNGGEPKAYAEEPPEG